MARQPRTGELGVAVQAHWFSVGAVVSWAEAGVGAVAMQSLGEPAYGQRALDLMRGGLSARRALTALLAVDPHAAERQVAMVDCRGRVAARTGSRCIESAGHHVGKGYSVQASLPQSERIVPAMVEAFEAAGGPLGERLLAALWAGDSARGPDPGRRSAAILVVRGRMSGLVTRDRLLDLRVDDHAAPVSELGRLMTLHRAYEHIRQGDEAVSRGDMPRALEAYGAAAELAPDNLETAYWHALALASNGHLDDALPVLRRVFASEPQWIDLTRRLDRPGLIPDTDEGRALVERILSLAPAPRMSAVASG